MHGSAWTIEFYEDAAAFLDVAGGHLAGDPVPATVVATDARRAADAAAGGREAPAHPRWWAVVRDGSGELAGVAMRTARFAPYPLFLLSMPDEAARELARVLHARGERVTGHNGALPAARICAEESARLQGGAAAVHTHMRLFELGDLAEPAPVPGGLRAATAADEELCGEWLRVFLSDAAEQAGRREDAEDGEQFSAAQVAERIAGGRIWLWEDDGAVVHLTGHHPASFGVARIGPVYTPRAHRGRGYASAAVAEVSRRLRDQGARVCLFTDQANPTSNGIYQALGYRPVVDMANLVIT